MLRTKLKEIPFEKADYSVFDFETTGTSARTDKVIEIGIVKISKGKLTDTFQSFINPGRPVPYFITQFTGITNSDVQDAPYFDEVYHKIKEFVGDSILVAHNLAFDHSFLRHECLNAELEMLRNPAICTLKTARRLYPDAPSKSLGKITRYLKIRHRNVHRALGDATATAKLLIKMFNALRENYDVETVSDIISFQNLPSGKPLKIIKKKMAEDFSSVPDAPGVYFFKDTKEGTIYIGKAKSLKQRISNYFASNSPRKSKEIARKASGLEFKITNTELTALLAEAELIKEHNPKLNKLLKQYSRNYFIKLSTAENFAAADVASKFDFDGNDYFGPYPNRETANSIKEIIDKTFLLRECTNKELAKKRKCYLSDIERCIAPCVDNEVKNLYTDEINKVHEFLSGHNQSAVDRLLAKMKELSNQQKFEEAALVRDVINSILKQLNKASILSEPLNRANVLVEILGEKNNDYVLLLEGKMFIYNFFTNKTNYFEDALNDYFAGTRILFNELTDKDLERLKITLNWLIKNKHKIKIHYLKDYSAAEDLAKEFIFLKSKSTNYELID